MTSDTLKQKWVQAGFKEVSGPFWSTAWLVDGKNWNPAFGTMSLHKVVDMAAKDYLELYNEVVKLRQEKDAKQFRLGRP